MSDTQVRHVGIRMAKASREDIEMALQLSGMLETLAEHGYFPSEGEAPERRFDEDNPDHCREAMALIFDKLKGGSLFRVTFGMSMLCDPRNRVIDPDSDVLELPPETRVNAKNAARYLHLRDHADRAHVTSLVGTAGEVMDAAVDASKS